MPDATQAQATGLRAPAVQDAALLIGRLLIAALFLIAAYNKFRAFDGIVGYFGKLGLPMPGIVLPLVLVFEVVVGVMLVVGYKLRWVALVTGLYCVAAGLVAHNNWADGNQLNHFLKNVGLLGGCLALMVAGAGAYSVDGRDG